MGKIFTSIIQDRLYPTGLNPIVNWMSPRANRKTTDAIFIINTITQIFRKKPLYACFVDFSKAFNKVHHALLWEKLASIGISSKMLSILQNMYAQATSRVEAVHLITTCSCNCLLPSSSHTSNPYHICPNELLCFVMPIRCNPYGLIAFMAELDTISRVVLKIITTACGFWNLDYFRYFIPPFCVSRGLKTSTSLPSSMCPHFIHYFSLHLQMLVLNYMDTTSDEMSGYGNHFTDVVLMLESSGIATKPSRVDVCHISSSVLL